MVAVPPTQYSRCLHVPKLTWSVWFCASSWSDAARPNQLHPCGNGNFAKGESLDRRSRNSKNPRSASPSIGYKGEPRKCDEFRLPTLWRHSQWSSPKPGLGRSSGSHRSHQLYLIAKNPSKQRYRKTLMMSLNPALCSSPRLPSVENGSRTPLRLRVLAKISSEVMPLLAL